MNLIIDIGNTRVKAALFSNGKLNEVFVYQNIECFDAEFNLESRNIARVIVSSVVKNLEPWSSKLMIKIPGLFFSKDTPIPIPNNYITKDTLGPDRLAAAIAASAQFPNTAALNVDTGTCIKYNFINAVSGFEGGAISPGLKMRLQALHSFTSGLPLVEYKEDYSKLIAKSTNDSILSGALLGAVAEVEETIRIYRELFPNLKVVLSGGDTEFFAKRLKSSIFARPNLVLEGLNIILEYNA